MVFDSDIEKKIIDFVKKSPIGVTSSEIAGYLNINRITLSKYLSVIKERALIDFKQLGMAKLWYIPVNISKEMVLNKIVEHILSNLDNEQARALISKAGLELGKEIESMYKNFYSVEKMGVEQVCEAITDSMGKIGGKFNVVDKTNEKLIISCAQCPFGTKPNSALCAVTSNIIGVITAKNFGYSKVILKKTIAQGNDSCRIIVYLKKTKESEKEIAKEYQSTD